MNKQEKIEMINGWGIPGISVSEDNKVDDLNAIIDFKNSVEAFDQLKKSTEALIGDLNTKIDELQATNAELISTNKELNEALVSAETKQTGSSNPTFTAKGKKYEIVGAGICVIEGVGRSLTKEEISKDKEIQSHLVEIQSGFIKELN